MLTLIIKAITEKKLTVVLQIKVMKMIQNKMGTHYFRLLKLNLTNFHLLIMNNYTVKIQSVKISHFLKIIIMFLIVFKKFNRTLILVTWFPKYQIIVNLRIRMNFI